MRLMGWEDSRKLVDSLYQSLDAVVPKISSHVNRNVLTSLLFGHYESQRHHAFSSFSQKPHDPGQEFEYGGNRYTFSITRIIDAQRLFEHNLTLSDWFFHGWGRFSSSRLVYGMINSEMREIVGSNKDNSHNMALGKLKTYSSVDDNGRPLSVSIPILGIPGAKPKEMDIISAWMIERTEAHVKRGGMRGYLSYFRKVQPSQFFSQLTSANPTQ